MRHWALGVLAAVVLLVSSCVPAAITSVQRVPVDTQAIAADIPRIDASTSASPLAMLALCKVLGLPYVWTDKAFSRERGILPRYDSSSSRGIPVDRLPYASGTNQSYMRLARGETDLILVARAPSGDELQAAAEKHVRFEIKPIALDAFVFLVNAKNSVDSLSPEQLRGIYTGRFKDWGQIGGRTEQINPYTRDRNSGSQELMEALVMKGEPMVKAPDMEVATMMGPVNKVGDDLQGIGYSVYYYVTAMLPDERVKLLAVDGIKPSKISIERRTYPFVTEVYAVTRADLPKNSTALMLRDWFLTPAGREAVAESGYVPMPGLP